MKTQLLIALLLVASLGGNLLVLQRERRIESALAARHLTPAAFPVDQTMADLQRYADKLWRAGQAGNWDLAEFYRAKLAQSTNALVEASAITNGFPVGKTAAAMLVPAISALGKPISSHDATGFQAAYPRLVTTCNTCHQASGHPYLRIATPEPSAERWNQVFDVR